MLDEGKSMSSAARDLDLTATSLAEWSSGARADRTNRKTGLTTAPAKSTTFLFLPCLPYLL